MEYVCVNASKDSNNFACFSNLSVYGGLMVGQAGPSFEEATASVMRMAKEYEANGFTIKFTRHPLDSFDFAMLRECGAI